ncbi:MAG: ABC transporter ATP-binding protein [Planctomycetota bacterium]
MDAVVTHGLTKRYGRCLALDRLQFHVPAGRLFGFLGPNGAGKTTALRLLLGLLRPTAGRADVLGHDAWRSGPLLRREVGYLPGELRLYDGLTGRATLAFFERARRVDARAEIDRLVRRLDLDLGNRVRNYSRGMKQKLGVIIALMHRPKLLIMDEPTVGLDPLIREVLFDELRMVAGAGRTVLFSSHTLAEVEVLCDEVAILRDGRLVEQERVAVLRGRALRRVEVRWSDGSASANGARAARSPRGAPPPGLDIAEEQDGYLRGVWRGPVAPLVRWLAEQPIADVTIAPPQLEDLFLAYYRDAGGPA